MQQLCFMLQHKLNLLLQWNMFFLYVNFCDDYHHMLLNFGRSYASLVTKGAGSLPPSRCPEGTPPKGNNQFLENVALLGCRLACLHGQIL